jgi:dTDP-4-amino-4,6-dideoxygalactose transaminase
MREAVAQRYNKAFRASNRIVIPRVIEGAQSTWAQYTIQVPDRVKLQAEMKANGIPSAVYYPIPLSAQKGYKHFPSAPTPVSDKICKTVIALPMHPYLDAATQDRIIETVLAAV